MTPTLIGSGDAVKRCTRPVHCGATSVLRGAGRPAGPEHDARDRSIVGDVSERLVAAARARSGPAPHAILPYKRPSRPRTTMMHCV